MVLVVWVYYLSYLTADPLCTLIFQHPQLGQRDVVRMCEALINSVNQSRQPHSLLTLSRVCLSGDRSPRSKIISIGSNTWDGSVGPNRNFIVGSGLMLANIDSSLNEETRRKKTATARDISQLTHLITLTEANANAVTSTT